jgi:Fibronectin type III domain
MQKAKRGFGSGRIVWVTMLSSLGVALAGCAGNDSGSSGSATTSSASTSSTTPPTVSDSAASASSGSTTAGSTAATGSTGSTTTTTPPAGSQSSTSVTLGWMPPTQNSNGTPITDLAGYKIHYGTASQDYTQVVAVNNPSLSRYVVDSLPSGTYFFAITAYNSQGIESALSGEVSTTLN